MLCETLNIAALSVQTRALAMVREFSLRFQTHFFVRF
jgi:hypothetical protein